MADELLRTKLMPPAGHTGLIERDRLQERLVFGLDLPMTLVVAPAGAGKTSLIRAWRASEHGRGAPLAWIALDDDDNDPVRFWRYVFAAIASIDPLRAEDATALLDTSREAAVQQALVALINALSDLDQRWVLAFDDYHLIETSHIHEQMTYLVENLPPRLRLVILTRADPPLPLARWRARGQMAEIRNADLRFSEREAAELMRVETHAPLSESQVARLTSRTEGWAAGLHLAALALRNRDDADSFLESFTGSHHFVLTYLAEDVLDRLPADIQRFLLETSILNQLTGSLCDAVTGTSGGETTLQRLANANLFTIPLDESGTWYRYHQLFAGVLHHQLQQRSPDVMRLLHQRASTWYESQRLVSPAIEHALKSGDMDGATRLIQSTVRATLIGGEARQVQRWIDSVPAGVLNKNVRLLMAGGWAQLIIGPLDQVEAWIERAELALPEDTSVIPDEWRGEAAALRTMMSSFQGRTAETIVQANEALKYLPESDLVLRGLVNMSQGQAFRFDGMMENAADAYRKAVNLGLTVGNLYAAIDSMADLGIVLMRQGKLRDAHDLFQRGERELEARNASHLPVAGAIATIWPDILYEMNQPERGLELALHGLELGKQGAKADLLVNGNRSVGTAYWALREWDKAIEYLSESARVSRDYGLRHTTRSIEARIAHVHLSMGDIAEAQAWAARHRPDPSLPGTVREIEDVMLARVCIASGDPDTALRILAPLADAAASEGRLLSSIEIDILQALAFQATGDHARATQHIARALGFAAPQGYVRRFLDEGPGMAALLRAAIADNRESAFATTLLGLLGDDQLPHRAPQPAANEALVESLSDRELAVLRLLAAGLNAPQIADELFVAASTVRTHVKNIYRKLDVHSRDQAISRAGELGLV